MPNRLESSKRCRWGWRGKKVKRNVKGDNSGWGSSGIKRTHRWCMWARAVCGDRWRQLEEEPYKRGLLQKTWEELIQTRFLPRRNDGDNERQQTSCVKVAGDVRPQIHHWTAMKKTILRLLAVTTNSQIMKGKCRELTAWEAIRERIPRQQSGINQLLWLKISEQLNQVKFKLKIFYIKSIAWVDADSRGNKKIKLPIGNRKL